METQARIISFIVPYYVKLSEHLFKIREKKWVFHLDLTLTALSSSPITETDLHELDDRN